MIFFQIKKKSACYLISAFVLILSGCGADATDTSGRDGQENEHPQHTSGSAEQGSDQAVRQEEGSHEGDHDEHEELVSLGREEMAEFGIQVELARAGDLTRRISLPGEIKLNGDRLVHIVPRLPGVVREVKKSLGDRVKAGEVLAVIESWELAEAAAKHVAASVRLNLAEANFNREKELYQKKITSLEDFLQAKQNLIEARIEQEMAEQKHRALDLEDNYHDEGTGRHGMPSAIYEIIAPLSGTVIQKHISLGEVLKADTKAFLLADLSMVWTDLSVYQKDLPYVQQGQSVTITAGHGIPEVRAEIDYMGPVVGETTRTALARVILPNRDGLWKPGLFVTAYLDAVSRPVGLMVRSSAVQEVHGQPAVFIQTPEGFRVQHVTPGGQDERWTEITSGMEEGQAYVAEGAFLLKAQLSKAAFGHGHIH